MHDGIFMATAEKKFLSLTKSYLGDSKSYVALRESPI